MPSKATKQLTGNAGDFSGIVLKAAARGDSAAVKKYLQVNPLWLNQQGPHGRTMLWEAAYKKRNKLVAELIALGADVNPMGSYYTPMLVELSALAVARAANNHQLIELLEKHGAHDDLYAACYRGDLPAITDFLERDPDAVNRPSKDVPYHPRAGFHAVHYAVAGGQLAALRLLVGFGANVGEHLTLLVDWADGEQKMIAYIRDQAKAQGVPASKRSTKNPKTDNVPAIDRPDWMGFPPLVDACRGNHNAPDDPQRVAEILAKGANVNITDHKGKTPLHRSCQAGFEKITNLLLEHGALLEPVDAKGCTPIFDAAHHGRGPVVQLLIGQGVNIEHPDQRGETPLFAAARGGHLESFQVLLNSGANLNHQNAHGKTVYDIVSRTRHKTEERKSILDLIEQSSIVKKKRRIRKHK